MWPAGRVKGALVQAPGRAEHSQPGPSHPLLPTPLPHGHEAAWAGSGWTGIRYSRPSVWEERRAWNRRERTWLEERERSLRGSVAQDLKRNLGKTPLAQSTWWKGTLPSWTSGGICFAGLGLGLGLRPSALGQRAHVEWRREAWSGSPHCTAGA